MRTKRRYAQVMPCYKHRFENYPGPHHREVPSVVYCTVLPPCIVEVCFTYAFQMSMREHETAARETLRICRDALVRIKSSLEHNYEKWANSTKHPIQWETKTRLKTNSLLERGADFCNRALMDLPDPVVFRDRVHIVHVPADEPEHHPGAPVLPEMVNYY